MLHTYVAQEVGRVKREEMVREAEQHRLVSQARAGQPGITDRIAAGLGDLMVEAGERLQKHAPLRPDTEPGWAAK